MAGQIPPLIISTNTPATGQKSATQNCDDPLICPVNAIKVSIYEKGAVESRDGKNSTVVKFTDTNFDHKIGIGDIVEFTTNGVKKTATIKGTRDVDAQISATEILLNDGSVIKTSKQNMFKAASLLNFKEKDLTPDGKELKIDTKLDPAEMFNAVNRLFFDTDRILKKDNTSTAKLTEKLKATPDGLKYLQKAPSSYSENETQAITENRITTMPNFKAIKEFILKPAVKDLEEPLSKNELDKPTWNFGLCIGLYENLEPKQ